VVACRLRSSFAALFRCPADDHTLPKLDRHHTALNRAFIRILHELQELQSARHNTHSDNDMGQLGFVLKNDNSSLSAADVASVAGVAQPPSAASGPVSGVAQAPSLAAVSVPPSAVAVQPSSLTSVLSSQSSALAVTVPPPSLSFSAPGARWPSLDDRQPIGPESLLLAVTDPRHKPAEDQT
jgi:hypothetical protein